MKNNFKNFKQSFYYHQIDSKSGWFLDFLVPGTTRSIIMSCLNAITCMHGFISIVGLLGSLQIIHIYIGMLYMFLIAT